MKRPGWAITIGILMLLFGGCGAFNRVSEIMLPEITDLMNETIVEIENNSNSDDIDEELQKDDEVIDSMSNRNAKKIEELSEDERKMLDLLSDTILVDENNNVDMDATMARTAFISDYRKTWMVRFGYIGLFIAVLFIIGGIMLLGYKKYTIQVVLTVIALSIASNILQIIIYAADKESGTLIGTFGSIGLYVSLAIDILLLILVMVLDKTFFRPVVVQEDYYD